MNTNYKQSYMIAISYLVLGMILCLFNVHILTNALSLFGIIFGFISVYFLYQYFYLHTTTLSQCCLGFLGLIFALVLTFKPETILSILPILTGLILICNGINQFHKSMILKDYGYPNWIIQLTLAIIGLIAGILLFFKPIASLSFIIQLIGVFLIIQAIILFFSIHIQNKYY